MAELERLVVYPVKGLDGIALERTEILDGGTLRHDREFALYDDEGDVINGKRTPRVHDLATDFEPETGVLRVETSAGETRDFDLGAEREHAERAPAFEIGGVRFEGVTPCGRCVVPERGPDTGEPIPEFRERFVEKRRETVPEWADDDAFDHYYTLMLIARVSEADRSSHPGPERKRDRRGVSGEKTLLQFTLTNYALFR